MATDSRARILEFAQKRFVEQGYDATSLREIAEDLGFTKAALYYHFQSKDQILIALLAPADELIQEMLGRLEAAEGVAGWGEVLDWLIDQMHRYAEFFALAERNRAAISNLDQTASVLNDHRTMHQRIQALVHDKSDDLHERVRMISALAAVTGFDDWAPQLLFGTDPDLIRAELKSMVADVLQLKPKPKPRAKR